MFLNINATTGDSSRMQAIYDLAEDIVNLLDADNISHVELYNYKQYEPIPRIAVISIYIDGDWKHDHLRADYLVKENFNVIKVESYETEDTGSDWGPEVHDYYIYMDE